MVSLEEFIKTTCSMYPGDKDRLGRLCVNLNCLIWDDLLGEKPPGYDTMTYLEQHVLTRQYYMHILTLLSEEERSMYWWTL